MLSDHGREFLRGIGEKRAPVQAWTGRSIPEAVHLAAEVYCHLFGPQSALIEGGCRGGFSAAELIAFLYARSFPREEWRRRFDEVLRSDPDAGR